METYRRSVEAGLPAWVAILEQSLGPMPVAARTRMLANDAQALMAMVASDRPPLDEPLRRYAGPVLLFAGTRDPLLSDVIASARARPGTHVVELTDFDHVQMCVRPAILSAYLRFVEAVRSTSTR